MGYWSEEIWQENGRWHFQWIDTTGRNQHLIFAAKTRELAERYMQFVDVPPMLSDPNSAEKDI